MKWLIFLFTLLLVACGNVPHGVSRQATAASLPKTSDAEAFLKSLPGVSHVQVIRGEGRTNLEVWLGANKGFREDIAVTYEGFSFFITFDRRERKDSVFVWYHENTNSNERPFRHTLAEMRAHMQTVLDALAARFPSLLSWQQMREHTWGPEGP
jgi:hypothetical protein